MGKKRRVSVTLTDEQFEQLEFVAERFGFSKAAVVSGIVSEALPAVYAMTEASYKRRESEEPAATMRRVRGVSIDLLTSALKDVVN